MFVAGAFSSDPSRPCQVDAEGLRRLTEGDIRRGFQVVRADRLCCHTRVLPVSLCLLLFLQLPLPEHTHTHSHSH